MNSQQSICVIGSVNADISIRVPRFVRPGETLKGRDFQFSPGGKGANQAVAAARLGGKCACWPHWARPLWRGDFPSS